MRDLAVKIYRYINQIVKTRVAKRQAPKISQMPSYYPEKERKCQADREKDNIEWAKKYHEANEFYTLYGLDITGSNSDVYIDYNTFMETRNQANQIMKWGGLANSHTKR